MPSLPTHLYDLPPELLDEIFKRMDIKTLETVGCVCKFLKERVDNFKLNNKELIDTKIMNARAYIDEEADDEDDMCYYDSDGGDHYDDGDLDDLEEDMLDRLSFGSNYDEDIQEYFNDS